MKFRNSFTLECCMTIVLRNESGCLHKTAGFVRFLSENSLRSKFFCRHFSCAHSQLFQIFLLFQPFTASLSEPFKIFF